MRSFGIGIVAMTVLGLLTGLILDRARVPTTSEQPPSVRLAG